MHRFLVLNLFATISKQVEGERFNIYLTIDHTHIIPSSEPETRRESSLEKTIHFKDLRWARHVLSNLPLVTYKLCQSYENPSFR